MRLLHTSDWHLGKHLYGQRRTDEFDAFLSWLADTLAQQQVDVLIVAGDIFDTNTPSNTAQQQYYRFLHQVATQHCQHVVVIAGNHDSATFLEAPKSLLHDLNVHVVGVTDPEAIHEQVLLLHDRNGHALGIVCAVPYLRDRDVRPSQAGESVTDKDRNLVDAIHAHYAAIAQLAIERQQALPSPVPIVATGHLFTAGGQTVDGDGVRELYVGSLGYIHASAFHEAFDYVALGHLHVPQRVANQDRIRYCGSPIPMGFNEATQQKLVCLVELTAQQPPVITELPVPSFQRLQQVRGSWEEISAQINALVAAQQSVWVEVLYQDALLISDLRERVQALVEGTAVEVLRIQNRPLVDQVLTQQAATECLSELRHDQVFERCLQAHSIPEAQQAELIPYYQQAVQSLHDDDPQA